jgi:hypothetical protein
MSKIAKYLNEHIMGEITGAKAVRERFSRDRSVLTIKPELVMFPRVTNDLRKAARFSWQLAEKVQDQMKPVPQSVEVLLLTQLPTLTELCTLR